MLVVVANQALIILLPLRPETASSSYKPQDCSLQMVKKLGPPEVLGWEQMGNPLERLPRSYLRLLPSAPTPSPAAPKARRWIAFGMSTIRRPMASYMGITISRLFHVMGTAKDTAIVVHLADFNETWVAETRDWLADAFEDQVEAGRLHAIHAREQLYPLQPVVLSGLVLEGFTTQGLNGHYRKAGEVLNGQYSYLHDSGQFVLYWCDRSGKSAGARHWSVTHASQLSQVRRGACLALVRAPEEHKVLDVSVVGWEELEGQKWVLRTQAGIASPEAEVAQRLKFGDSPQRQYWRSKQNLDYAFLMWYAADMADFYMQLEDDIQVVPHFLPSIRSFVDRSLAGEPWLMTSFSTLGFIGKLFNASRLPSLAEFLFTLNPEAPCDWLVWDWMDALTSQPFTSQIPQEAEKDFKKWQVAKREGTTKDVRRPREDLPMYFLREDRKWPELFSNPPPTVDLVKPPLEPNAGVAKFPAAVIRTNFGAGNSKHPAAHVYPPGDKGAFWTGETCGDKVPEQGGPVSSEEAKCVKEKFLEIAFREPVALNSVEIKMGSEKHPNDYIKNGLLSAAYEWDTSKADCAGFQPLKTLQAAREVWRGQLPQKAWCIRVELTRAQKEWIWVKEISVAAAPPARRLSSRQVPPELPSKVQESSPDHAAALYSGMAAAAVGLLAGLVALLIVHLSGRACPKSLEMVGVPTCWALCFIHVLDAVFLLTFSTPEIVLAADDVECEPIAPDKITWQQLEPGIRHVKLSALQLPGAEMEEGSSSSSSSGPRQKWLAVGVIVDHHQDPEEVKEVAQRLVAATDSAAAVVLLIAQDLEQQGERSLFIKKIKARLSEFSELRNVVHLVDPPLQLYPKPPASPRNLDLALLVTYCEPLAEYFLEVEPRAIPSAGLLTNLQAFTESLGSTPWLVALLSPAGHQRKLIPRRLLLRWAELLVMFRQEPPEALFWTFVDVSFNGTSLHPFALWMRDNAMKRRRVDVVLQHQHNEVLIEHLGDVSSLEGKVQRQHENFDCESDGLFNDPPATLSTNLRGRRDMLQSLYDGSRPSKSVLCGAHKAESCAECPQGHGAGWCNFECQWAQGKCAAVFRTDAVLSIKDDEEGWIELVFKEPMDVETVNVRMGGQVTPAAQCAPGTSCREAEMPDSEFRHTLDDANMKFGWGTNSGKAEACGRYEFVTPVAGREVFWRSAQSRPARGVRCIRFSIPKAQRRSLLLRDLQVRAFKAKGGSEDAPWKKATPTERAVAGPALRKVAPRQPVHPVSHPDLQVAQLEWGLLVSVSFMSGALVGVLLCARGASKTPKRRGRTAPVP